MKKRRNSAILLGLISICWLGASLAGKAATDRAGNIKSTGIINYDDKVIINSDDFRYLATEIDGLEKGYKAGIVTSINKIGTYFTADGTPTTDSAQNAINGENAESLSFDTILTAIEKSQSVESVSSVQATDTIGEPLADEAGQPIYYGAADIGNLSAGTAAWVDGRLLLGNGEESRKQFEKGYQEGYNQGLGEVKEKIVPPVVRKGTISGKNIKIMGNQIVGYVTIPTNLEYFCGGITSTADCRAHFNVEGAGSEQFVASTSVSYNKRNGIVTFIVDLGKGVYIGAAPEIKYSIMYPESPDMHIHQPECYGECTVTVNTDEVYSYEAGHPLKTFYKQSVTETHSSCIFPTVDRSRIQTSPIDNPAAAGTTTYKHKGTKPTCGK